MKANRQPLVQVDLLTGKIAALDPHNQLRVIQSSISSATIAVVNASTEAPIGYLRIASEKDIKREVAILNALAEAGDIIPTVIQVGNGVKIANIPNQTFSFRITTPMSGQSLKNSQLPISFAPQLYTEIGLHLARLHAIGIEKQDELDGIDTVKHIFSGPEVLNEITAYLDRLNDDPEVPLFLKEKIPQFKKDLNSLVGHYLEVLAEGEVGICHRDLSASNMNVMSQGHFLGFLDFGESGIDLLIEDVARFAVQLADEHHDVFVEAYKEARLYIDPDFDLDSFEKSIDGIEALELIRQILSASSKEHLRQNLSALIERYDLIHSAFKSGLSREGL